MTLQIYSSIANKIGLKLFYMIESLFADLQVRANKVISTFENLHKMKLRITQGLRTFDEQAAIYAQGRTTPGKIVTDAMPGYSLHNYGLSFDCAFAGSDPYLERYDKSESEFYWNEYGNLAIGFGLEWGGNFPNIDRPHCEKKYGFTIEELKALYDTFGITGVYSVINQKLTKGYL